MANHQIACYSKEIKLKWGIVNIWIQHRNNYNWDYQVYWTDTDTGSDNTLEMKKNQKFKGIEPVVAHALKIVRDYFEEHETKLRIEDNISKLTEIIRTF